MATKLFVKGDPRINRTGQNAGSKHFTTLIKDALKQVATLKQGNPDKLTYEQLLADSIIKRAIGKSDKLAELIWNYYDGKPIQGIMLGGDVENPVQVAIVSSVRKIYGKKK